MSPNGVCGRKVGVKKASMLAKLEVLKRYLMLAKLETWLEKAWYGIADAFQRSGQNYSKRESFGYCSYRNDSRGKWLNHRQHQHWDGQKGILSRKNLKSEKILNGFLKKSVSKKSFWEEASCHFISEKTTKGLLNLEIRKFWCLMEITFKP